jgi:hypothetical protein
MYENENDIQRFWSRVDKEKSSVFYNGERCWEWTAWTNKGGYGRMRIGLRKILAHRFAYQITNGEVPDGLLVCHQCDNPSCCNPSHLFLGTNQDNVDDRDRKGRMARGERNGTYTHPESRVRKLSDAQVSSIRRRYADGAATQRELAIEFGVSHAQIGNIVNNKHWRDTP